MLKPTKSGPNGVIRFAVLITAVMTAACLAAACVSDAELIRAKGMLDWRTYRPGDLAPGSNYGRPVMVFFTQKDCWFCRQMQVRAFPDPRVRRLGPGLILIYVNLSDVTSVVHDRLVTRFGIVRTPTTVFLGRGGREMRRLRLTGIRGPAVLADTMRAALKRDQGAFASGSAR